MDPFLNVDPDNNITLSDATVQRALDVTLDPDPTDILSLFQNDDTANLSLGAPVAESTAMDLAAADAPNDPVTNEDPADDNVLSFFKGPRGGKNCSYNGRCYTYDRMVSSTDTTYWQCARRKEFTPQCTGRLYTRQTEVVRMTNHICEKSIDYVIKKKTLSEIRFDSAATETPASIISRHMMNVPECVRVILPNVDNMKRTVRQYRAKSRPCAPSDTNFLIPDEYTVDADDNRFLLADKLTESQERLLVFGSDTCLDALQDCRTTFSYLDGTFSTSPQGFKQIWVLRSTLEDDDMGKMNFNAAYCLLPNKRADSYKSALREIKSAAPLWSPDGIVIDYEKAEIKAIKEIFPDVALAGCHFHFNQSLLRRFRTMGSIYKENEELRMLLHFLYALPFVPESDIITAWNAYSGELSQRYPSIASVIVPYFENTWLNGDFPIPMWNCYLRTLAGQPRTNNVSEGSNNALRSHFGCANPTVWLCISKFKELQAVTDTNLSKFLARSWSKPKQKAKLLKREDRICELVRFYDRTDMLNYLKRLSFNFIQ